MPEHERLVVLERLHLEQRVAPAPLVRTTRFPQHESLSTGCFHLGQLLVQMSSRVTPLVGVHTNVLCVLTQCSLCGLEALFEATPAAGASKTRNVRVLQRSPALWLLATE